MYVFMEALNSYIVHNMIPQSCQRQPQFISSVNIITTFFQFFKINSQSLCFLFQMYTKYFQKLVLCPMLLLGNCIHLDLASNNNTSLHKLLNIYKMLRFLLKLTVRAGPRCIFTAPWTITSTHNYQVHFTIFIIIHKFDYVQINMPS